jgi:serine/threonine-protein kinase RsbW
MTAQPDLSAEAAADGRARLRKRSIMTDPVAFPTPSVDTSRRPVRRASFMFEATLEDASLVAQALRVFLPPEVGDDARNEIEIGVVEAMSNIVRHSYGASETGIIAVSYDFCGDLIVIELTDHGRPVADPNQFQGGSDKFAFDPEDIAALPEGGMGIPLMLAAFDRVEYRSDGGANTLRLEKSIAAA